MVLQTQASQRPLQTDQNTIFSTKTKDPDQLYSRTVTKTSNHRSSSGAEGLRILLSAFSGGKKNGRSEASARLERSKRNNFSQILQDGESPVHITSNRNNGLDALDRFVRCLSAYTGASDLPEIPTLCNRSSAFSVPKPSVWDIDGSQNLYEGLTTDHSTPKRKRAKGLDDIILLADSQQFAIQHRAILIFILQQFGWVINWKKSSLVPTQRMIFLGAELDTNSNTVGLPQEKIRPLIHKIKNLLAAEHLSAGLCLSILGSMSSTFLMVQWSQWNSRVFQNAFLSQWNGSSMKQRIFTSQAVKRSAWWWTRVSNLTHCRPIVPPLPEIATTDASLQEWGAHYQHHVTQGRWSFRPQGIVSNVLELRAAWQAILTFRPFLAGSSVLLRMDNTVVVNYIHKQGGTRSRTLMKEVRPILEWAQVHLTDLKATYVPGIQNQLADDLSRIFVSNNEWSLSPQAFALITCKWGIPDIDLAATPENKCLRFSARNDYPTAAGIDCLRHPWEFHLGYIFPPIPLIARFLARLRNSTSTVIAVLPFWPRRPWFTTILQLNTEEPLPLPLSPNLLSQGRFLHPSPERLHLTAWRFKGKGCWIKDVHSE